jgi:prolyl oligopeptidase
MLSRVVVFALVAVASLAQAQEHRYPVTRRAEQSDVLHGVRVADPYRWLEDTDSPETRAWIDAQNAVTNAFLASIPEREAIRRRLTQLWNHPRAGVPEKEGGRYFFTENSGLQNQAVLYVQDSRAAPPRVLLDPNLLSPDGTVSLAQWSPAPNGRLLAYGISSGGSDWRELRVRHVFSRRDLADTVKWVKFSGISWTRDSRGFFYSRYEPDTGNALTRVVKQHRLYYHRLGTPQTRDELVFEQPEHPGRLVFGEVSDDGQYLVIDIAEGTEVKNRLYLIDLGNPGRPVLNNPVVRLLDRADAAYSFVGNIGPVFVVRTDNDAPRGRVVGIDINMARPAAWATLVPQGKDALESASLIGDRLVVSALEDARSTVRIYESVRPLSSNDPRRLPPRPPRPDAPIDAAADRLLTRPPYRLVRQLQLPTLGTVSEISGDSDDPEMFYDFTSFLYPRTIFRSDVRRTTSEIFRTPRLPFDQSQYETKQVFYTSKDGTRVPMFITARKGLTLDGNNPTLLYGYGGFNIATPPAFSVLNLVWLEVGGVYAHANLRGGSEYGRDWHDAGRLSNKQNVFNDFIAAAEYLVRERYTSPAKLAIWGRSNGGLLVGAAINQRPDLFGAAIPIVGVMDMLRFHKFTIGGAWVSDYGSPDNPEQFRTLFAYSPLHNIKPGTRYPATLILTADHDDRVVPGHSFKYAAALQAAQGGPAPILIRIETRAGHGAGTPTTKQIEEATDRLAFLVRVLGIRPNLAR